MSENKQKIGILGGSFDPIHNGHLSIAEDALKEMALDKILLIPAAQSPLKSFTPRATSDNRLEMLR